MSNDKSDFHDLLSVIEQHMTPYQKIDSDPNKARIQFKGDLLAFISHLKEKYNKILDLNSKDGMHGVIGLSKSTLIMLHEHLHGDPQFSKIEVAIDECHPYVRDLLVTEENVSEYNYHY